MSNVNSRMPILEWVLLVLAIMVLVALFKRLGLSEFARPAYYATICVAAAGWFNRKSSRYAWYWVTLLAAAVLHVPLIMLFARLVGPNASVPTWALALWAVADVGLITLALLFMPLYFGNRLEETED